MSFSTQQYLDGGIRVHQYPHTQMEDRSPDHK